jgi:PAS domain-containing protein
MCAFPDLEVYRSILEILPTGVCAVNAQKRIVLWSDGAERITGRQIKSRNSAALPTSACVSPTPPSIPRTAVFR